MTPVIPAVYFTEVLLCQLLKTAFLHGFYHRFCRNSRAREKGHLLKKVC